MNKLFIILLALFSVLNAAGQPPCNAHLVSTIATGGVEPFGVAVSPTGRCLAVGNFTSNTISLFGIDKNGCGVTPTPIQIINSGGTGPSGLSFSPDGSCLIVANSMSNNISVFSVNADCTVTLTQTIATGNLQPVFATFSPNGKCFAVNNQGSSTVSIFSLTSKKCPKKCVNVCFAQLIQNVSSGGSQPGSLAYSPDGSCLVVANFNSQNLALFSVDPVTCILTQTGTVPVPDAFPVYVAFSPDGTCFASTNNSPGIVKLYTVSGCALTLNQSIPDAGGEPGGLAFSQNGSCLMVANEATNNVNIYQITNCTGTLVQTLPAQVPFLVALMPCKKCFVVTNGGSNSISIFKFNCP